MREEDRRTCRELALVPGSAFGAVHGFLPRQEQDRVLALEALFRSLRDIPFSVSDPSVGIAKLSWWQQELHRAPSEGSQHPVVRALLDSGALQAMSGDEFSGYLHGLVAALQDESVSDVATLLDGLKQTAGLESLLLAGPFEGEMASVTRARLMTAGATSRLLELIQRLARGEGDAPWLPMDLVARHQFQPGVDGRKRLPGLVADLAAVALNSKEEGIDPAACQTAGACCVALRDDVVIRRLKAICAAPNVWETRVTRSSVRQVFATWRLARRLVRVQ